ncbi:hypothetical protein TWF696_007282 [Orbilia brochopaga]|uniref:Uncharacterized protein n=1 Tax=Orbilia brochopaga TaxID=3140254 RepID=A0AAV9UVP2_9PEZI
MPQLPEGPSAEEWERHKPFIMELVLQGWSNGACCRLLRRFNMKARQRSGPK